LDSRDSQPNDSHDKSDSTGEAQGKTKWSMTPQAWGKLLNAFDSDPDEAGRQYQQTQARLIRFFEWQSIRRSDYWADETLNRVARRLDEGQPVDNLQGYIFGVARMALHEARKEENERTPVPLDETREGQHIPTPAPVEPDEREECFDRCLERVLPENRTLILEYYQEERRAKIELRQRLADRLGIPLNALRIRAHRIRMALEKCITECLENIQARNK
jgi:DNA-directed RNA polymerase specialized sigma24 family protein